MIGLYFLIGALALLVTELLFGFVGCGFSASVGSPSQDYPTSVKSTADLVAYWRPGGLHRTSG